MNGTKHTNALIHESSPYLLQHAHNPVDWKPWNEEVLALAKAEDKPLLISIGYSACHWCHVMERECFEDEEVAAIMNRHFVCIKVDREERPDVDQVYMDAVQLMTQSGGWPLNCFALPDGRPFFGGTYFPQDRWKQILESVQSTYTEERSKVETYANQLLHGMHAMDELPVRVVPDRFTDEAVETGVARWRKRFDSTYGGRSGAPKFPLPNNYAFLLQYAHQEGDQDVLQHVHLTLREMAFGGIYDQVGGGFARYSVDEHWKVPHFEKMLYDNAQLMSLYSDAYSATKNPLYLEVIEQTAQFLRREMQSPEGLFYSALDADSEGTEGKFYTWTKDEILALAGENATIIEDYYNVNSVGQWEDGRYILLRRSSDEALAKRHGCTVEVLKEHVANFKEIAMQERSRRIRPGLDDKCLTGWNALTITGFAKAYQATNKQSYLHTALECMSALWSNQRKDDGGLWRNFKAKRSTILAYLEDYALVIEALIELHRSTLDQKFLGDAQALANYVFDHFEQNDAGMFYFKSKLDAALVKSKAEIYDDVIPASNSVLATCLMKLGLLYSDQRFLDQAKRMMSSMEPNISSAPSGTSQWMKLLMHLSEPYYEVAIVGDNCEEKRSALSEYYLPNAVICGGQHEGDLPILKQRAVEGKTLIYVCRNGACQLPTEEVGEALAQIH